jgi:TPR repeat protein
VRSDRQSNRQAFEPNVDPFEQAIALGNPSAKNDLGVMYNEGDGVRRDVRLAREWFEKAAALGSPEAKQNLRGMRR